MVNKMVNKVPISIYILTYNNQRTIERCLKSLAWAEELVVVDSFSQDGTFGICQQYTDKVYQREWTGHRDQYQYAADLTTRDWIMFVDADEEVPLKLTEEIQRELDGGIVITMVFLFIDAPITWGNGFDTVDGIQMVRFGFIEGIKEGGRADSMQKLQWLAKWVS